MIDDENKSLMGEEKDPFESIVDVENDPFENQTSSTYTIPEEKPKPKRVKKEKNTVVEDDYFNPISHEKEDQVKPEGVHGFKAYRIAFIAIFLSVFGIRLIVQLFFWFLQWLGENI